MRTIRRHWHATGIGALVFVLAGAWLWHRAEARNTATMLFMLDGQGGGPNYPPIDRVKRDKIMTVFNDIGLDTDVLIALNLSNQSAESVISAVRAWQNTNEGNLASLSLALGQKAGAVRRIERTIAMGPADPANDTALATARQDLATAKANYKTALSSVESSVSELLSNAQRATWTASKSGLGPAMPIRMLDLSDSQRIGLSDARTRYERQMAAASDQEHREAAVSAWQTAQESILTNEQRTALQNYAGNLAAASGAVMQAYSTVMPMNEG